MLTFFRKYQYHIGVLLVFLITLASTGVVFHQHHCLDKGESHSSWWLSLEDCCEKEMQHEDCQSHTTASPQEQIHLDESSCCTSESTSLKADLKSDFFSFQSILLIVFWVVLLTTDWKFSLSNLAHQSYGESEILPQRYRQKPIILFQNFRL